MSQTEPREVVWMPALPGAVVTLVLSAIVFWLGAMLTLLALIVLAVRSARRQWTPLTWLCLGGVVGAAVFWVLIALHALF